MKIRQGYVSNSSSSSFILKDLSCLDQIHSLGFSYVKAYKVSKIKEILKDYVLSYLDMSDEELECYCKEICDREQLPWFLYERYIVCGDSLECIKRSFFSENSPSDDEYITSEIDRDEWYISGGGGLLGVDLYEGDL